MHPLREGEHETWPHLHHLQLLQALLHQLLYLPLVLDRLVLAERVPCSPLRVFSEIVRCELLALSEELAVLSRKVVNITVFFFPWDTRGCSVSCARCDAGPVLQPGPRGTHQRPHLLGRIALERR